MYTPNAETIERAIHAQELSEILATQSMESNAMLNKIQLERIAKADRDVRRMLGKYKINPVGGGRRVANSRYAFAVSADDRNIMHELTLNDLVGRRLAKTAMG